MPKCYSYIRFSRPEQMRGDSLRRQTEAAEKWATENGLVIDESLTDLGVSAYRGMNRVKGALGRFLELTTRGQVPKGSFLIIESLDRFSREDALDVLGEFTKVLKAGITIVTLMDGQVYSLKRIKDEPMALFGSLMVMMRAHEESKTKGKRVGEAWSRKRATAGTKVMTTRVPGWLRVVEDRDGKRIEFKPGGDGMPSGREIVRRIFLETIAGYGKRRVATHLNKAGVPTFEDGSAWHPSYVQKVLGNRAAIGEMQPYRRNEESRRVPAGPPVRDYYPAAVTEAEFIRANKAREVMVSAAGNVERGGAVNVFRGLARCSCGGRMVRLNKGRPPKGAAYLTCAEATRGHCQNARRWRLDWAEDRLLASTLRIDFGKVLANAEDMGEAPLTVVDLENKVAALRAGLGNIQGAVEAGVKEFLGRAVQLSAEVEATEKALGEARRMEARGRSEVSLDQRQVYIAELRARLQAAGDEEFAELRTRLAQEVRGAFTRIVFTPDRIYACFKGRRPFGVGWTEAEIDVRIFTDNPDDLLEMSQMELDPETLATQDRKVARFVERQRQRRLVQMEVPSEPGLGTSEDGLAALV